jgi:hypothetical protein
MENQNSIEQITFDQSGMWVLHWSYYVTPHLSSCSEHSQKLWSAAIDREKPVKKLGLKDVDHL